VSSSEAPSSGEQKPQPPSTQEQQPQGPSAEEQKPQPPSTQERQPQGPSAEEQKPQPPSTQEQQPQGPSAEEQQPQGLPQEELTRRKGVINDLGDWRRTFFKIPVRRLTPQEVVEALLIDQIKSDYLIDRLVSYSSISGEPPLHPTEPAVPADPLDKFRIIATLVMVIALFAIVAVIVFNRTPPSGITQLVSLASGLAGIGLGWLFGAASSRGKK
jgi:hypothetical protein